jgi:uncharacterized membrane protein YhhN
MMPFGGGLENTANGTLILSAALSVYYLLIVLQPPSWRRTLVKTASTALLALLAWLAGGPVLLVAGLLLSALGDTFMAEEGEHAFMGGLVAFLLAQLAYAVLFTLGGGGIDVLMQPLRLALAVVMVVISVAMLSILWPSVERRLKIPVGIYLAAILAMGLAALTVDSWVVILGALLFMTSDCVLGVQKFLLAADAPQRRMTEPTIWILYYSAQVLITLGVLQLAA